MRDQGMIVRVQFQAGAAQGDWNTELRDPRTDRPINQLSDLALDDATFAQNALRDLRPMTDLKDFAAVRAQMIERHFLDCAHKLISEIERKEGWPHAQPHKPEPE